MLYDAANLQKSTLIAEFRSLRATGQSHQSAHDDVMGQADEVLRDLVDSDLPGWEDVAGLMSWWADVDPRTI